MNIRNEIKRQWLRIRDETKRQWLRFVLCEPEEWIEVFCLRVKVDAGWEKDVSAYHKRKDRYEFAFGPWKPEDYKPE